MILWVSPPPQPAGEDKVDDRVVREKGEQRSALTRGDLLEAGCRVKEVSSVHRGSRFSEAVRYLEGTHGEKLLRFSQKQILGKLAKTGEKMTITGLIEKRVKEKHEEC